MNTKKQLDRLFKEQFRNMDVAPPPAVWDNISIALQKKKENKRAVPLWYKLAGVAAALMLFFGVGSLFFNPLGLNQITSEDTNNPVDTEIYTPSTTPFVPSEKSDAIVIESNDFLQFDEATISEKPQKTLHSISENPISQSGAQKKHKQSENDASDTAAQHTQKSQTETPLVQTEITQNKIPTKIQNGSEVSETKNASETETQIETAIAETNANTDTNSEILEENIEENKKSLLDYIAEKDEEAIVNTNSSIENRWDIAPNFAPVYYSSLKNGSSIDPQFSNNPKSSDINYSYGIKVSYAINDKLSVRTGINKVDLSYTTNNIEFSIATSSQGLQSINYENPNYSIVVGTLGSLKPLTSYLINVESGFTIAIPRSEIKSGEMKQELDYFEIPMELKYNLLNNRFGVNVLGGMSTLLLNNNTVSVLSDGFQTEIGSANNLNSLSFSTNVGLGFDYKFSNNFVFNLEPMFKYQLNPYKDSSIDFKPYYLGVYSGFSYRF